LCGGCEDNATAFDQHKNFAISTVLIAPSPPTTGTTLTVQSGNGALFPTPPFNATVCPLGAIATATNSEIVRVTSVGTDTLTIVRAQEGSTARTILVGDLIAATVTAKAFTDIETTPYARTDLTNVFAGVQEISGPTAAVIQRWRDTSQPSGSRLWNLLHVGGDLYTQPANDDGSAVLSHALRCRRSGSIEAFADIFEKQRATALGHWIDVPYSAANFTTNVGTWTVEAADLATHAYCLIGKTLLVSVYINGSSVAGSPTELRVAWPPPGQGRSYQQQPFFFFDGSGSYQVGAAQTVPAGTTVALLKDPGAAGTWTTTTNGTHIRATLTISLL